jgi:hypothetical protein
VTEPKVATFYQGDARYYEHPLAFNPPDRVPFASHAIGVTSVLNVIAKPAIYNDAAKKAAAYAVKFPDEWASLPKTAAIELIKGAPRRYMNEAADLGTQVHAVCESIARWVYFGEEKPDVPEHLKGYAFHYLAFLRQMGAVPLTLERTVWHHTLGYAGTFDGIYEMAGRIAMVDIKSGQAGTFPEVALQQAAYMHAEVIVNPDGSEEEIDWRHHDAYALWLRPHGYALKPLKVGLPTWECFQHLLHIVQYQARHEAFAIGKPINPTPITNGKAPKS